MSIELILMKMRSGRAIDDNEKRIILEKINHSSDQFLLSELIYEYAYNYKSCDELHDTLEKYATTPVPGLTAVILKVALDICCMGEFENFILHYLDYEMMDIWYDEVIFSSSYVMRNIDKLDENYKTALFKLREIAIRDQRESLLNLFRYNNYFD